MSQVVGYTCPLFDEPDDVKVLHDAGVDRIVVDDARPPGVTSEVLWAEVARWEPGDVLVVSSASRLETSMSRLLATLAEITRRGVLVRILNAPALSTSDGREEVASAYVALDQVQRGLVGLRTRQGMKDAAGDGRRPGRPSVMTTEMVALARELRGQGRSVAHISRVLKVSPGAIRRGLQRDLT